MRFSFGLFFSFALILCIQFGSVFSQGIVDTWSDPTIIETSKMCCLPDSISITKSSLPQEWIAQFRYPRDSQCGARWVTQFRISQVATPGVQNNTYDAECKLSGGSLTTLYNFKQLRYSFSF